MTGPFVNNPIGASLRLIGSEMEHKVLLVGGAGYVGRHLAFYLTDRGYDVCILDNLSTGSKAYLPACEIVVGDIADIAITDLPERWRDVNCVIHLAAFTDAGASCFAPWETFGLNVGGTCKAMDLARDLGAEKFLFSSTAAVYGDPECIPISEGHRLCPKNPYGESKRVAEWVIDIKGQEYSIRTGVLRYFNVAGADPERRTGDMRRDSGSVFHKLLDHIDSADERPFYINGDDYDTRDGTPERDFIHVTDLAAAHECMMDVLNGETVRQLTLNAGYNTGVTVRELYLAMKSVAPDRISGKCVIGGKRPGDIGKSIADATRLHGYGWRPKYADIAIMLRDSLAWHDRIYGTTSN